MFKRFFILLPLIYLFNITDMTAQDWPGLARFKTANDSLLQLPLDSNRVVFMGNSITQGWLQKDLTFFKNPSYINRGISGQTTPQMLVRFRQDVVALCPAAVVILAGINDIAGNTGPSTLSMILDNITSMAEIATANNIKVILCSVLPADHIAWQAEIPSATLVPQLNKGIKAYALANGHTYLDYFSEMVNDTNGLQADYTYDGVHATLEGYKQMERIAKPVIDSVLGNR